MDNPQPTLLRLTGEPKWISLSASFFLSYISASCCGMINVTRRHLPPTHIWTHIVMFVYRYYRDKYRQTLQNNQKMYAERECSLDTGGTIFLFLDLDNWMEISGYLVICSPFIIRVTFCLPVIGLQQYDHSEIPYKSSHMHSGNEWRFEHSTRTIPA